ncbi:hypothetical protein [Citricoccus sp. NR2]|uniref:hypothetical protein n=1 Tax=Citricoccus sp. NR2 TaxID=3004095 RepID=UPI0022DDA10B|nr:hypothetical protein [Citricoccus sp. NR2]WBL19695.1 hypothetical protein O1A05_03085 [Citricoccus sp. NR2]
MIFWAVMAVVIWPIGPQTTHSRSFGYDTIRACDTLLRSPDRVLVLDAVHLTGSVRDQISLGCVTAIGSVQSQLNLALSVTVIGTLLLLFALILRTPAADKLSKPSTGNRTGARVVTGLLLVTLIAGSVTALVH